MTMTSWASATLRKALDGFLVLVVYTVRETEAVVPEGISGR